jgi:PhnB protein
MALRPYLNFNGNCREAFTRYKEIFGGELVVMTMADVPEGEGPVPADQADLVLHASLTWGDDNMLMASDDPTGGYETPRGVYASYSQADPAESKRVFEALAEGGEVTMPIAQTFWSPMFGMCTDKFGTPWMIDTDNPDFQP